MPEQPRIGRGEVVGEQVQKLRAVDVVDERRRTSFENHKRWVTGCDLKDSNSPGNKIGGAVCSTAMKHAIVKKLHQDGLREGSVA